METHNYHYYAFISYSRANEKEAKWLQKKLESYRLPAVLQKQYETVPKEPMKIFLDKTDIGGGGTVEKALSNELSDSKNLIVLCSPESAKSKYVEYEIESFIKLRGNCDNIFPFAISGIIKEGAEDDCFTPLLHKHNLNAIEVRELGKRDAFIKLLASLLGIKYNDIKQREKQRLIRKAALQSACGTVIACLLFATVWFFTPHTKYYADYITRYSLPEGIPELHLTKKQTKTMPEHYAITTKWGIFNWGNKPVKLAHQNPYGLLLPELNNFERQNRPKYAEFEYKNWTSFSKNRQKWGLQKAKYTYNSNVLIDTKPEHEIWLEYSNTDDGTIIDFYYPSNDKMQKSLSNDVLSDASIFYSDIPVINVFSRDLSEIIGYYPEVRLFEDISSIFRWKILYDSHGFDERTEFFNKNNQPTSDINGIHGYECFYEKNGQIRNMHYLYDEDTYKQINETKYEYDNAKRLTKISYTETENNIFVMNSKRNFAYKTISYDDKENSIKIEFFDNGGKEIKCSFWDATFQKVVYDKNGCEKEESTENFTFEVLSHNKGFPTESIRFEGEEKSIFHVEYDKNGNEIKTGVFDEYGNLSYCAENIETIKDGVKTIETKTRQVMAEYGLQQFSTFNVYDKYGRHISEYTVWENGEKTEKAEIDYAGDNPRLFYTEEENGVSNPINSIFLGDDGNVYETFSSASYSFNNNGQLVSAKFKYSDGKSAISPHLYFSDYNASYTPKGLLEEESFIDSEYNSFSSLRYGYSKFISETDLEGSYYLWGKYLDENGDYANNHKKGYAYFNTEIPNANTRITRYYKADGRCVSEVTYKDNKYDQKVLYDYRGSFITKYVIDAQNRFIYSANLDLDGNLINREGKNYSYRIIEYTDIASVISDYDKDNIIISKMYKNKDGYTEKYEFYKHGNLTKVINYENEKITRIEEFGADGKIVILSTFEYDTKGNNTKTTENFENDTVQIVYHDSIDKIKNNSEGFAIYGTTYDNDGIKREIVFDENESQIFYLSSKIIFITDILENSQAEKAGFQKDDIILHWNGYDYFNKDTEAKLNDEVELGKSTEKQIVVYRPSDKKVYKFDLPEGSVGIGFTYKFAGDSIDTSKVYIAEIKSVYDKWRKKNKKAFK